MAAEGQPDKMASGMEVHLKQRSAIEILQEEKKKQKKKPPTDIHQPLLNISGDQTLDASTVSFSINKSNVKDKPQSEQPCTAVTSENEEHLNQFICAKVVTMLKNNVP